MKRYESVAQLPLPLVDQVKEERKEPRKRVQMVSVKLARGASLMDEKRNITSPDDAHQLFRQFSPEVDREHFVVLCLDTKSQPTAIHTCHMGSLNASVVHPREVLKSAILAHACSVIVAHNPPSNDPTPSSEDIEVTKRLTEAAKIIGIELLDHVIVCDESFVSLKEEGYV